MVRSQAGRILLACLVGGVVFLGAGTVLADEAPDARAPAEGGAARPVDETVTLPAQNFGDRITYALDLYIEEEVFGEFEAFWFNSTMTFQWNGTGEAVDRWGRVRQAERVQSTIYEGLDPDADEGEEPEREDLVYWIAPGSQEVIQMEDLLFEHDISPGVPLPIPLLPTTQVYDTFVRYRQFDMPASDCILTLGQRTFGPDEGLHLDSPCGLLGGPLLQSADRVPSDDGLMRFNGTDSGKQVSLVLRPDLPYPVSMEAPGAWPDMKVVRLTMLGFERGQDPRGEPQAPGKVLQGEFGPLDPWGPSEEGFEHPFPASEAYAFLTGPLQPVPLTDFRDTHDAYVVASFYHEEDTPPTRDSTWFFVWAGDRALLVTSVLAHAPLGQAVPELNAAKILEATSEEPRAMDPDEHYPARDQLPDEVPTLASMASRWDLMTGGLPAPNGWGFSHGCEEAACDQVNSGFSLSLSRFTTLRGPGESGFAREWVDLSFAADHSAMGSFAVLLDHTSHAVLPVGETPPPAQAPKERDHVLPVLSGVAPSLSPSAAAGAGALALASAAITYFLATLKAGPMALFSRLIPDRLAQHPVRKRILDAVAAEPGIHFKALGRKTAIANGTLVHHVRHLERAGLLVARSSSGYTCYFLLAEPSAIRAAGATKADGARALLDAVRAHPGLSGQELAAATGLGPSTVSYHAQRLGDAGLVRAQRDGRAWRYHPQLAT